MKTLVSEYYNTYDEIGKLIHRKYSNGVEVNYKYDENGNLTDITKTLGNNMHCDYDSNNNLIHTIYEKCSDYDITAHEQWIERHSNGKTSKRHVKYEKYEFWQECDINGNVIHYKDSNGDEYFYENKYNDAGNLIYDKNITTGYENWYEYDKNGNEIRHTFTDSTIKCKEYNDKNLITCEYEVGKPKKFYHEYEYDSDGRVTISRIYMVREDK